MSERDWETVHETTHGLDEPGTGTYGVDRTYRLVGGERPTRLVRVEVLCDSSYPWQSHYRASVWGGFLRGWVQVARIDGNDPLALTTMASGHLPRDQRDAVRASLERMAQTLLDRAEAVVLS